MFGLFNRKRKVASNLDQTSLNVADTAAAMIAMNLTICRSVNNYKKKLNSLFVRGYFVGFLDAAGQLAKLNLARDEDFFEFIVAGHAFLKGDVKDPVEYALASLHLQGEPSFSAGQKAGRGDYFDSLQGKLSYPRQLVNYLHND